MGETDKKEFYRREMHSDKTALGSAINALLRLENRWPDANKKIEETVIFLKAIRDTLTEEGLEAYKPKETILDLDYIEKVVTKPTAEELAAESEAKRLVKEAEEKAKLEAKEKKDKIAKLKADLKELDVESD